MLLSADDEPGRPTRELIDLAINVVSAAKDVDLSDLSRRIKSGVPYPDIWPGEHYKLLAGIVKVLEPSLVIEIGTATGLSALAMLRFLPPGGRLMTFDLVSWRDYPDCVLTEDDFAGGALTQHLDDLSDAEVFDRYRETIEKADLVFIDAAKDGVQEQRFLELLEGCRFSESPLVIFDDIRLWNMLRIWREITRPKLDLTSFGHWSGTGLIRWHRPSRDRV
jgi:predicted O-methyltransferase YrrM